MSRPTTYHPPYAPSPYSYTPNPTLSSPISLDEEIKLSLTSQQRELNESLAEIFSIIVTLDYVEKAFVKDVIAQEEYTVTCSRLLGQYKTILKNESVREAFGDLERFKREFDISYPSATSRLLTGLPATYEHPTGGPSSSANPNSTSTPHYPSHPPTTHPSARLAAEATQHFITFLDALRLNYNAKDQLHPLLSDVITAVSNVTSADFEGRASIVNWLIRLNRMGAGDEVSEQERRQMVWDIEEAYAGFIKTLE
ncbi:vacuolar protein sorting-associated [Tirmania nivea]|nr:vacuolar protein sorting-associated [Tirmania nivea]